MADAAAQTQTQQQPAPGPASPERKAQVETLLADVFRLMDYPAKLELKDMPDGGIGVAVHFDGEVPGVTPGKRSYLVDCIQFLVNKALNRPNLERRWVSLGVGAFPEPRGPRPVVAKSAEGAPAEAKAPEKKSDKKAEKKADKKKKGGEKKDDGHKKDKGGDHGEVDEHSLEVEEEPKLTALARMLAEKSAKLGRPYALVMLSAEDRARVLKAAKGIEGVTVKCEGKKHLRRVAFVPHKLTPMPRRHFMADDDDDEA